MDFYGGDLETGDSQWGCLAGPIKLRVCMIAGALFGREREALHKELLRHFKNLAI